MFQCSKRRGSVLLSEPSVATNWDAKHLKGEVLYFGKRPLMFLVEMRGSVERRGFVVWNMKLLFAARRSKLVWGLKTDRKWELIHLAVASCLTLRAFLCKKQTGVFPKTWNYSFIPYFSNPSLYYTPNWQANCISAASIEQASPTCRQKKGTFQFSFTPLLFPPSIFYKSWLLVLWYVYVSDFIMEWTEKDALKRRHAKSSGTHEGRILFLVILHFFSIIIIIIIWILADGDRLRV